MMGIRTGTRKLLAACGVGVVALVAVPASANADPIVSELGIANGTLVAKGVGVRVPLTYACQGDMAFFSVQVRQRVSGGALAYGSAFGDSFSNAPVVCDGAPHVVTVTVFADPSLETTAFKAGTAYIIANFSACDEFAICPNLTRETEIRLTNK